jgi:hypothetical protein
MLLTKYIKMTLYLQQNCLFFDHHEIGMFVPSYIVVKLYTITETLTNKVIN